MTSTVEGEPAAQAGRATRRRDRRKAEMISAALEILSSSGYQGMRFEDVAERTDIAKATLYHYFPSKDALVAEALEKLTTDVLTSLGGALEAATDLSATDQLRALIAEQLHILTVRYPEVGKVFSFPAPWPPVHSEAIKSMRMRHDQLFRRVVDLGVATGEFDCPDPSVALHCLHGILNHASIWLRPDADPDGQTRAAVVDEAMRLFARA
ncbi:TetR/AcrR family transcriptional regulator of autoinduction and epiphytic fitness [Rhodococcus sp. PvR044]|jgi:TetR/AcrR family transcriptional regulator, regulator of autoinduction and epiphytic fitness|uniref:TetR/AcrR family transcriptional regulator n=1 Tax=Rhodococcus TaxID=1827 RepID=UPI000BE3AD58|nr:MULTISPECIES: TetR/AcrR family transcriptional regulator [Rhodococcus]MBP1160129.1 AcrR family transcriptional regulator [Rhodococcus sp. PvR099]MCZ4557153.1 TetR/AcrR family transcriptional regulator [Rhodococcus maanshanensis]